MKRPLFFAAAAVLFIWSSFAHADIEYWKVVEVTGFAQMKSPVEPEWKALSAPSYLKRGSLVRTGKDGAVDFSLNRQWDSFLRLSADSEMQISEKSSEEVRLKKGSLFVLLEAEPVSAPPLRLVLPQPVFILSSGGLAAAVTETGTELKVFGETAQIEGVPEAVEEGWGWTDGRTWRMDFSDYADWQRWVRKTYDRKDKYFLKRSL